MGCSETGILRVVHIRVEVVRRTQQVARTVERGSFETLRSSLIATGTLNTAYVGTHIYTFGMTLLDQIAAVRQPGDTIRERRIDLGWTQTELARRSGVTQADISKIENGHLDARWSTIQKLSMILAKESAFHSS